MSGLAFLMGIWLVALRYGQCRAYTFDELDNSKSVLQPTQLLVLPAQSMLPLVLVNTSASLSTWMQLVIILLLLTCVTLCPLEGDVLMS